MLTAMSQGRKTASSLNIAWSKTINVTNYGVAPHFNYLLLGRLRKSDIYVYLFDKWLNEVTQTGDMDRWKSYWDVIKHHVNVRY